MYVYIFMYVLICFVVFIYLYLFAFFPIFRLLELDCVCGRFFSLGLCLDRWANMWIELVEVVEDRCLDLSFSWDDFVVFFFFFCVIYYYYFLYFAFIFLGREVIWVAYVDLWCFCFISDDSIESDISVLVCLIIRTSFLCRNKFWWLLEDKAEGSS